MLIELPVSQTVIQRKPVGDEESTSSLTSENGLRSLVDSSLRSASFRMTAAVYAELERRFLSSRCSGPGQRTKLSSKLGLKFIGSGATCLVRQQPAMNSVVGSDLYAAGRSRAICPRPHGQRLTQQAKLRAAVTLAGRSFTAYSLVQDEILLR